MFLSFIYVKILIVMCNELNIFIFMYQLFVNPALIIYIKEVYMVLLYIKFRQANYIFQTLMI